MPYLCGGSGQESILDCCHFSYGSFHSYICIVIK
nr:MAG TPA: hypothetical protein [Caudoviricetes sp.]